MLTYLTAGESHGPQLTAIVNGLPAGMPVDIAAINYQLARRQKGYGRGGRMKIENDEARIVSGVRHGHTMGGPVTLIVENRDWSNWQTIMHPVNQAPVEIDEKLRRLNEDTSTPRPGHADLIGGIKYNHHDLRNVLERASARETAARVAAGSLGRQLLEQFGVNFVAHTIRIGEVTLEKPADYNDIDRILELSEASEVRCINPTTEKRMIEAIEAAKKQKDSLGGVTELIVAGLPSGLGGFMQSSDRIDGKLAQTLMSIQSVKGVEVGDGFASAARSGSVAHDEIYYDPSGDAKKKGFYRKTNRAGGIEGGMTTGENIILHVACKPISTLNRPLETVDVRTKLAAKAMVERTDNCVVPALGVVCEAAAAMVLAAAFLDKFGSDNLEETRRNYNSWLDWQY